MTDARGAESASHTPVGRHFLDDFAPGDRIVAPGSYDMTPERVRAFASEYDPQPIHVDERTAAAELFGGLVASGWHSLTATMRLMVDARPFGSTPLVGVSIDRLRFIRPVRPGDLLTAEAEVLEVRASQSRPEQGFLRMRIDTRNQDGDAVVTQEWTVMLPTRPAAGWRA